MDAAGKADEQRHAALGRPSIRVVGGNHHNRPLQPAGCTQRLDDVAHVVVGLAQLAVERVARAVRSREDQCLRVVAAAVRVEEMRVNEPGLRCGRKVARQRLDSTFVLPVRRFLPPLDVGVDINRVPADRRGDRRARPAARRHHA